MKTTKFRKEIVFHPAWDKRDPDPNKNYGIHCVDMCFYLHGKKGVIQFVVFTNWFLEQNREHSEIDQYPFKYWQSPMPSDLGFHSYVPVYEGQHLLTESCPLLHSKPCYYDGSTLNAEPVFETLIREGSEGVWKELKRYYEETFKKIE